jgi:ABC-type oligopeptide transport system ATPase subunit
MTDSVEVEAVTKRFTSRFTAQHTVAVDSVSFRAAAGESFGIVGESGSGKTTLARMILGLTPPTSGTIEVEGVDVWHGRREQRRSLPSKIQVVFQDPYSSMNPRMRIDLIIGEGLRGRPKAERQAEVERHLELVGLTSRTAGLRPHELSGGQRQRVAIARALAMNPQVLVADEPVSALDVSVRGQILNLLADLREKYGLTTLFISHDLGVVRQFCEQVIVMSKGKIVERGEPGAIFDNPQDPYTASLVASIPRLPGGRA